MNRQTALHNVQLTCPEMATYMVNTYRAPPSLSVANSNGTEILSEEGCTQGDNAGMAFYSSNTIPLISLLHNVPCMQAWFADDSAAAGLTKELRNWWDTLNAKGPSMGYIPNAAKTWLILKHSDKIEEAKQIFHDTGVNVTCFGKKHLGACLGSPSSKEEFVTKKVDNWVDQLEKPSSFANADPHAAYAAFTFGFMQKWKYIQRTMPEIKHLFHPLESCIRNTFIPSLIGRAVSDTERKIFELPTKLGGLNIQNPVNTAEKEYEWSRKLTQPLTTKIVQQLLLFEESAEELEANHHQLVRTVRDEKKTLQKIQSDILLQEVNSEMERSLQLATGKGASIWLNTLPIKKLGYSLNKQEFQDAIALRYNFKVKGMSAHCACGKANTVDHALVCV